MGMEHQLGIPYWFCSLDSVQGSTCTGLKDVCQIDSIRFSTVYHKADSYQRASNNDDDMCQMDEDDFFIDSSVKSKSLLASDDIKVPSLFFVRPLLFWMFHVMICNFLTLS